MKYTQNFSKHQIKIFVSFLEYAYDHIRNTDPKVDVIAVLQHISQASDNEGFYTLSFSFSHLKSIIYALKYCYNNITNTTAQRGAASLLQHISLSVRINDRNQIGREHTTIQASESKISTKQEILNTY